MPTGLLPRRARNRRGEASFTLAWKPAESGQQDLVRWFDDGTVLAYKIKYPNGAVDVPWLGKQPG
jgi:uncharacterized protein YjdB